MSTTTEKKARYAFWEHDKFPYVLSGKVERGEGEKVVVEGYGGLRFTPLTIIRGEKGKLAHDNLNWLKSQYRDEQDQLFKHYCNLALGLAPFLKQCKQTSAYRKAKA